MRKMDLHNRDHLDGSFAFEKSVKNAQLETVPPMKEKAAAPHGKHAHVHGSIDIEEEKKAVALPHEHAHVHDETEAPPQGHSQIRGPKIEEDC